jgi:tetratricopeptide (TPR) repeat protein
LIGRAIAACTLLLVGGGIAAAAPSDLASLERAIAADPENLRAVAEYRQLAIAAKAFDRSIDFLANLAKQPNAGPNVAISLALAYVDKVPTSGEIRRLYLGRDAVNALTKSIERRPSVLAYYLRGVVNLFYNNLIFKRIPRGLEDLNQALALVTLQTPPALTARIYASLGDGYWRLEDRPKAREIWTTAIAKFPDDSELKRRLDADAEKVRWVVSDALSANMRVDTTLRGVVP